MRGLSLGHRRWLGMIILVAGGAGQALLFGQGVAVSGRKARPSPLVKGDLTPPDVRFEDVAAGRLEFYHTAGDPANKTYILETTGSGAAIFDYDNDGLPDILLVNGTRWQPAKDQAEPTNKLFRNRGGLKFEDVTAKAGLERSGWGQGVCAGDYDNDENDDLLITYYGQNVLYHNQGDGTFRDVTAEAGLPAQGTRWATGCAFVDYDRDGRLDLAVANYVSFDPARAPKPGENNFCTYKGLPVLCGPRGLPGGTNVLYRNLGDGKFADVSKASGFAKPSGYYCFSVLTGDFDNDGWTDIYVACDSTPSILYRNNRDGTFSDIGMISGAALSEHGVEQAGMGAAAGDFNNDGRPDIVKTNFADDTPTLYKNEGEGFFTDVTFLAGLGVNTNFVGWGVGFVDIDHDGWKDLVMVNGHVYPSIDQLGLNSPYQQQKNVYWNLGNGAFLDISAHAGPGIVAPSSARGAAFGDLNGDGVLEIVVNNIDGKPALLVNREGKGNWLLVRTRGVQSNRSGIGARVAVRAGAKVQVDEVRSGGSFMSHNDKRLHFGLGSATTVDCIEIRWPNGRSERFGPVPANREILLQEGAGTGVKDSAGQPAEACSAVQ